MTPPAHAATVYDMSIGSGTNNPSPLSRTYIHSCFPSNETNLFDSDKITVDKADLEMLIVLRPYAMSLFVRSESVCQYHNPGCCDLHDRLREASPRTGAAHALLYDLRLLRTDQQGPLDPQQLIRHLDQVIKDSKDKHATDRFADKFTWTKTFVPDNSQSVFRFDTTGTLKDQSQSNYKMPKTFTFQANVSSRES